MGRRTIMPAVSRLTLTDGAPPATRPTRDPVSARHGQSALQSALAARRRSVTSERHICAWAVSTVVDQCVSKTKEVHCCPCTCPFVKFGTGSGRGRGSVVELEADPNVCMLSSRAEHRSVVSPGSSSHAGPQQMTSNLADPIRSLKLKLESSHLRRLCPATCTAHAVRSVYVYVRCRMLG